MSNIIEEKIAGQTCSTEAKTCSTEGKTKSEVAGNENLEEKSGQCSENKTHPEGTRLAVKKEGCCGL